MTLRRRKSTSRFLKDMLSEGAPYTSMLHRKKKVESAGKKRANSKTIKAKDRVMQVDLFVGRTIVEKGEHMNEPVKCRRH